MNIRQVRLIINGRQRQAAVTVRSTLADFLRNQMGLTGTHLGCEHGVCGSCTVLLDGEAVRSCLMLAVQADGREVLTVEGLAEEGQSCRLQNSFRNNNGLQCGFCTPGFLMSATALLKSGQRIDEQTVRGALSGNLCRCTGYKGIVDAVMEAARSDDEGGDDAVAPRGEELIGASVDRVEDERLLHGRGLYTSDIRLPGLTHAAFLRSPHAHARVVAIRTEAARTAPGVLAVLTFADIATTARPLPQVQPHNDLISRLPYPLVKDVVRHAGEPVAVVLAESVYEAEDAADLIEVEYEVLAATVGAEAGLRETAPLVHEDLPDNVAGRFGQEVGDVERALEGAHAVVTERIAIGRVSGQPLETRAVTASYEAGKLNVWLTTQSPHMSRRVFAEQLGLSLTDVRVVAPDIGGGFGPKNRFYPEYTLVAMLAMRLGRPVAWVEDRRESFTATYHEREQVHEVTLGLDADGKILALRDRYLHDQGAYTPIGVVVPYITSVMIPGPYRVPNYKVDCTMVFTHKTPNAPYRGAGKPQATFVMERILDAGARRLGLDPIEIRRRNLLRPEDFPYETGLTDLDNTQVVYDSGQYHACLERALELIRHEDFAREQAEARRSGRSIGLGVSCYATMTGRGPFEGARVRVEPDGRVCVYSGVSSQGQGHQTTLAQICAEHLGVALSEVSVRLGDTDFIEKSIGTYAARVTVMAGNAVALAARSVREKVLLNASQVLGALPDELELAGGVVRVRAEPERSVGLAVLARRVDAPAALDEGTTQELETTTYYQNSRTAIANGSYAVVVEVDRQTGVVRVIRHALAHDCGVMVNPRIVEGQIYGGVAQGLSEMLFEEMLYDDDGTPLNTSYKNYLLPTAPLVPSLAISHLETPSPFNPLGVKGAGEGGTVPVAPAVAAAIEDALGHTVRVRRRPIHPADLLRLICEEGGSPT
jgi:carbon-monoxide dehydrogenase large subunit